VKKTIVWLAVLGGAALVIVAWSLIFWSRWAGPYPECAAIIAELDEECASMNKAEEGRRRYWYHIQEWGRRTVSGKEVHIEVARMHYMHIFADGDRCQGEVLDFTIENGKVTGWTTGGTGWARCR
jgi:hypothetical protein